MLATRTFEYYATATDEQLVYFICDGDQQAFEVLVRRYSGPIFTYCCRLLRDTYAAKDLSQDIFLRVYISLPKIDHERTFRPWIFQVAHNCCIDEIRRKHRHALAFSQITSENDEDDTTLNSIPDSAPLPEEQAEQQDMQSILQQAIELLPTKYCAVTSLRYTQQLSFAEIGKILQIPESTAKTYFARAKKMLRTILEQRFHYSYEGIC